MSDSQSPDPMYEVYGTDVTVRDIRHAITGRAEVDEDVTVAEIVTDVAGRFDAREKDVKDELDKLERNGFVYLVGDGVSAEVRVP